MPVAQNAVTTGSGTSNAPALSHNPQGVDRGLICALFWSDPLGDAVFESGAFGGAPLTELGAPQVAGGGVLQVFRRAAPAAGAAQVAFAFSDPVNYAVVVASFTGMHQSAPTGALGVATGSSTLPTATVNDTVDGSMVFDAVGVFAISATIVGTPHGGQAQVAGLNAGSGIDRIYLGASVDDGGGAAALAWTLSHSRVWAHKGVELKPAPALSAFRRNWPPRKFGWGG